MSYKLSIKIDHDVYPMIKFIGETFRLGSKPYATGRGKRLWKQYTENTGRTEEDFQKMITKCKRWHSHGMNEDQTYFTVEDIGTLKILEQYCIALNSY